MSLVEITERHLDAAIGAVPVQKILSFLLYAIIIQIYLESGFDGFARLGGLTPNALFDLDTGVLSHLTVRSMVISVSCVVLGSWVFSIVRKKIFFLLNCVLMRNESYLRLVNSISGQVISINRYKEFRGELKSRKAVLSGRVWASELIFNIAAASIVVSIFDYSAIAMAVISLAAFLIVEISHHKSFVAEILPIIIILREKFGAKDLNYPC